MSHESEAPGKVQLYTAAMPTLLDHPLLFCPFVILFLFAGSLLGTWVRVRRAEAVARDAGSFKALEGAVLGLFALLLGFSFAMAVNRYDLRRQLEVEEANAIGTTWLRTDTLVEPERSAERQLIQQYVPVRLSFVAAGTDAQAIQRSLTQSGELQAQMWKIAAGGASARRDPISALFVASLNDAIDVTEKRTAALENRIPSMAWPSCSSWPLFPVRWLRSGLRRGRRGCSRFCLSWSASSLRSSSISTARAPGSFAFIRTA